MQVDVRDAKRKLSLTACSDAGGRLQFSDSPATAPVIHAGGRLVMNLPARRFLPSGVEAWDLMVQIGTPGLGVGTFAAVGCEGVPRNLHPVAEVEYSPKGGGKPIREKATLDRRCWGNLFHGPVRVPAEADGGKARITLSFPAWKEGAVAPATFEVSVGEPKIKGREGTAKPLP